MASSKASVTHRASVWRSLLASLPGVQRYGWLLILQNQATAAEDAAKSWRDAMNAPIAPRTIDGDPGE